MFENRWDDIAKNNSSILNGISEYNAKISKGAYIEFNQILGEDLYYNLISAHVIALLLEDGDLRITNEAYNILNLDRSAITREVKWSVCSGYKSIDRESSLVTLDKIADIVFDDRLISFIQEICAQDIVSSNRLAPSINSILSSIDTAIVLDSKGEEELYRLLIEIRNGKEKRNSRVAVRYAKEYSNRSVLIYNRLFKHNSRDRCEIIDVGLCNKDDYVLNCVRDTLFCQKAVLHVAVKATGSSGTAFRISDEYALTCAHVVEGANEVTANVIVGDGYPSEEWKDMGVYDVGFGEVVYSNPDLDIALLKTEYCGSYYLEIEQGNLLPEIGEEVVVFGYPLGFEMPQTNKFGPNISFYRGYVSSNQVKNKNSITYLDIDVKSGNSGSPVLSARTGKVIGIISGAKISGDLLFREKMPYMIPIQHFVELIKK